MFTSLKLKFSDKAFCFLILAYVFNTQQLVFLGVDIKKR